MASKKYLFNPERNPLSRGDYRPSEYKIETADLHINLDETATRVTSVIEVSANMRPPKAPGMKSEGGRGPLILEGEDLKLVSLKMLPNTPGEKIRDLDPSEYYIDNKVLIIKNPPKGNFSLKIVTEIDPAANTKLSGIYSSGDIICSQCEAQGFRRITYFLDRPDNLATFKVTLEADKKKYPILLSNGNGDYKNTKDLGNGRHAVTWNDPWPKPSYLFATVAGDLKVLEDTFTTMSGKKVDLRIFVQAGYDDKIAWAMESIKRAMTWDEQAYGREYDLDCFHVVGVDKFNAGAMENKGLNVFNVTRLVGDPDSSTDRELIDIEAVLGHEYFHNWTGDRVTLRDWFELTLKEGLTVLRDRQFTSDLHSAAIQTLDDANDMRAGQFLEDTSPSSHPIRPNLVEEFENIYSGTVYTKGSHVLGMMRTILGEKMWRTAMDAYFERYDGQAVTCDDFVNNMEEISGIDLTQFRRWYSQSGTPEVSYTGVYDPVKKTYSLTLTQNTPATADQPADQKQPLHIPVRVGLISESGKDVAEQLLHLTKKTQTFVFENVPGPVVPSVLRGFSAPVKVATQPSTDDLVFRMAHDSDPFNQYEAAERLMLNTIHELIKQCEEQIPFSVLPREFLDAYAVNVANATDGDLAFAARLLSPPPTNLVLQGLPSADPDTIHAALDFLRQNLTELFGDDFKRIYNETAAPAGEKYDVSPEQVGRRDLHNLSLSFLGRLETPDAAARAEQQYTRSSNMTERLAALSVLARQGGNTADAALENFYQRYKDNANVVNKWLMLQAGRDVKDVIGNLNSLMQHDAFDLTNPNKVSYVVAGFVGARDGAAFHRKDGSGYKWLADLVIKLNDVNGKTGSRIVKSLTQFSRYDADRQKLMIEQLERIMKTPKLESSIKEVVGQALDAAKKKSQPAVGQDNASKPK